MKVHQRQQQFTRGFWDHQSHSRPVDDHQVTPTCLSLGCKRLRPLAPKLPGNDVVSTTTTTTFDLKNFIKPDCGPRKLAPVPPNPDFKKDSFQVEAALTQPGGTRWNPTQEQIGILEALYCRGMRTPNAQQIEQITAQLSKYGKIEGKNVFYWFQNHKARERQKLKRRHSSTILGISLPPSPKTTTTTSFLSNTYTTTLCNTSSITLSFDSTKEDYWRREEQAATPLSKKKCTNWTFERLMQEPTLTIHNTTTNNELSNNSTVIEEEDGVTKITLNLFPLQPET
ncbi:hypothetical protein V2J09_007504 [Rumex salicifolius]